MATHCRDLQTGRLGNSWWQCSTGAGDKVLMGNSGGFEEDDDILYNGPCTPRTTLSETGAFLKVLVHVTATEVVKGELKTSAFACLCRLGHCAFSRKLSRSH